jgi:hypothetical protein
MKKMLLPMVIMVVLLFSCKRDPMPEPETTVSCCCTSEIDSVNVAVYLVDFDTMIPHVPAAIQVNNWHFINPYVITRSQGVVLDSVGLNIINYEGVIDTSFSFQGMLGFCYPTLIDGLKINSEHETTMEIWSGGIRLAIFYVAKTGFYNVFENYAGAFSSRWPFEAFSTLTRM